MRGITTYKTTTASYMEQSQSSGRMRTPLGPNARRHGHLLHWWFHTLTRWRHAALAHTHSSRARSTCAARTWCVCSSMRRTVIRPFNRIFSVEKQQIIPGEAVINVLIGCHACSTHRALLRRLCLRLGPSQTRSARRPAAGACAGTRTRRGMESPSLRSASRVRDT